MKRIIILPEELELIVHRLKEIEKIIRNDQKFIEDPILNTEGIMKLLNVSRRCLQNWRDSGLIEFSQVNGKFFYRVSAINKMLANHLNKMEE